jgi:3-oxoacyl-[acyl-carrier protein] reductase
MKSTPSNKNILITGASSEVGLDIANKFANQNNNMVLQHANNKSKKLITERIKDQNFNSIFPIQVDFNIDEEIENLINQIRESIGSLDIIIHNVGFYERERPMEPENILKETRIHVYSLMKLLQAFLPDMRKKEYGRIIAISSAAAYLGSNDPAYSSTKNALTGLMRSIGKQNAKHNITANSVLPGPINAGMGLKMNNTRKTAFLNQIPAGRFADIQEISEPVYFLCSKYASYINGVCLHINGGLYFAD